jgi:REP-associated tyrosine transposase
MARQPRLVLPDIALHIVQRGVDGEDCFRDVTDRVVYLSLLRELSAATRCAMHAYCLMTNHVHLLLTPAEANGPTTLMYKLGQRYVPYFNRRYGRTGTLWQGRFKSFLVQSARYVLACYRYIERNPVRAAMAHAPAAYAWSSHAGNAGLAEDKLLSPHVEYLALGVDPSSRHTHYRALCQVPDDDVMLKAIREATLGGYPLVGESLKARLATLTERSLEPGKPGRRPAEAPSQDSLSLDLGL